ncbi:hypothetical protein [Achromobacter xylosoxidans]|uniref:hypothetical protein n=1 Tax=Alcaligenes xylosoxydans xylosoxydans TaxID=85698 RepID=UPI001EEDD77D|nr:hypothetical protein [Achromobacter xylosoxidans]MEC6408919.1 hypothetical protein [Achromobacter xylosoxidans]
MDSWLAGHNAAMECWSVFAHASQLIDFQRIMWLSHGQRGAIKKFSHVHLSPKSGYYVEQAFSFLASGFRGRLQRL